MTKKEFQHDMVRGLGSAALELRKGDNLEKYRDIVMWGCTHRMTYDSYFEADRSGYLYDMLCCYAEYTDVTPFLEAMDQRL